jgi:uncharacterized protein (TIGR02147 family)
MQAQALLQDLLLQKLTDTQSKNPSFSLRAFAQRIGLSPGALSAVLNGKRKLSSKKIVEISKRLDLDPVESSKLFSALSSQHLESPQTLPTVEYTQLTLSQFKLVADWEHLAILSLIKTEDFKTDVEWIAERLGISSNRARSALSRLEELELVEQTKSGSLRRTPVPVQAGDLGKDQAVRRSHEQCLELAKESLHRDETSLRDFSALTLVLRPSQIPEAAKIIRRFQDELAHFLEAPALKAKGASAKKNNSPQEVYKLAVQLFPISFREK